MICQLIMANKEQNKGLGSKGQGCSLNKMVSVLVEMTFN